MSNQDAERDEIKDETHELQDDESGIEEEEEEEEEEDIDFEDEDGEDESEGENGDPEPDKANWIIIIRSSVAEIDDNQVNWCIHSFYSFLKYDR